MVDTSQKRDRNRRNVEKRKDKEERRRARTRAKRRQREGGAPPPAEHEHDLPPDLNAPVARIVPLAVIPAANSLPAAHPSAPAAETSRP